MAFFGWIVRFIAVLILVRMVVRLFSGAGRRTAAPRSAPAGGARTGTREGGHLVRDPNCGTYIPVTRALRSGAGDSAEYFCSDACRTAWGARRAG